MKVKVLFPIALIIVATPLAAQSWSLDSCLSYALEHNQDLLAKTQSITTAELSKKATWAQLAPEIEATAGLDHYWKIPVQVFPGELLGEPEGTFIPVRLGTPWMGDYGLEGRIKLVDPQSWQDIRTATIQEQMSRSEEKSYKKILFKNVSMAFHQAQQQQQNVVTSQKHHDSYSDIHNLIAQQFDKGLIDKIAYNQSSSLLKERESTLSKAEVALQSALIDLKFWMGYPLNEQLTLSGKKEILPAETLVFDPSLLPDYNIQKLKSQLAEQQYKSSLAQLYPSLSLTGGYRHLGFGESIDFLGQSEWYPSGFIGMELRIPLLSLSKMAYNPKKQKSEMKVADLEFENYVQEQNKKYLQEEIQMEEAWQSVLRQQENLQLAEENETLALQKIEKGIIDMIQLKQIQEDLSLAQEKLNEAELNFLKHFIELKYLQNK